MSTLQATPGTTLLRTYSYAEAAALLGVSRWTLRRAVRRKQLRATRLGRRVVFLERNLAAWLDSRTR